MTTHTSYMTRDFFQKELKTSIDSLISQYNQVSNVFVEELYPIRKDTLHFIGKTLSPKTPVERVLFKILGRAILQTETLSGGAAPMAYLYGLNLMREINLTQEVWGSNHSKLETEYQKFLDKSKEDIQLCYSLPTFEDFENIAANIFEDEPILKTAILETIKLAGFQGKIYVENSKQPIYFIEKKSGYTFKAKPFKFFLTTSNSWEHQNVKVLLVDGLVDKVSEIDRILKEAFETKQPAMIVARDFSEEVIATLKANFDKGFLNIIPVKINTDLESINILNDISSVCGTDIVSTIKGDMLCFKSFEELPTVSRIKCLMDQITIEETKTRSQVSAQVQHLLSKRQDTQVEDVVNLIDERIKALTSDVVCLRLPDITEAQNKAFRVKIDVFLRTIKSMINHNMVKPSDLVSRIENRPECNIQGSLDHCALKALRATVKQTENNKLSCLSMFLVLSLIGKQSLLLMTSDGVVFSDLVEQTANQQK